MVPSSSKLSLKYWGFPVAAMYSARATALPTGSAALRNSDVAEPQRLASVMTLAEVGGPGVDQHVQQPLAGLVGIGPRA